MFSQDYELSDGDWEIMNELQVSLNEESDLEIELATLRTKLQELHLSYDSSKSSSWQKTLTNKVLANIASCKVVKQQIINLRYAN